MGFDPITMAATISTLTASGQIGSDGKTEKTYTFDGVVGDKPFQNGHVWISADIPSINSIKSVTALFGSEDGTFQWITAEKDELRLEIDNSPDGDTEVAYLGEYSAVTILKSDLSGMGMPPGLWVLYGGDMGYVSSVTFESGEVHTIDPKYLPGLTLPVMELSEETATATLGMGTATVTDEEAAFLDKMVQEKAPFMVLVELQGMATTCLCQYGGDPESTSYSGCLFGTNRTDGEVTGITLQAFQFRKANGVWQSFYIARTVS